MQRFGLDPAEGEFAVSLERSGGPNDWHIFRGLMAPRGRSIHIGRSGWSADALEPWLRQRLLSDYTVNMSHSPAESAIGLSGAKVGGDASHTTQRLQQGPVLATTAPLPWAQTMAIFHAWEMDGSQLEHLVVNHADKDVFVAVFARWCPYCIRRRPTMDELARIFGPLGVVIANLYVGDRTPLARLGLDVGLFPAFFMFPQQADPKKRVTPTRYLGVQEVAEIEKFIRANAKINPS